jgi:hypothetical protein
MTIGTISQGLQFRLTGVTGNEFNARTKQNVRKRLESILYLETPPADAVKLAYVGSEEISPTNNLFIGDRSDTLYANSRTGTIQEFIGTSQPIPTNNNNFIVTQVFNEADSRSIPLYYKHTLTNTTSLIAESVRVYDKNFDPVSTDKYKLSLIYVYDETTGIPTETALEYHLYNNLESYFDIDTGEYEVYFIQYTEVVSGSEIVRTRLLDNHVIYTEAEWDDIWDLTGDLKPWAQAYIIDSTSRTITLPTGEEYAIKYLEQERMKVRPPVALSDTQPWFLRVTNRSFSSPYYTYAMDYSIPEFENQAFNPLEPYKIAVLVQSAKINNNLIKLPHGNIQSGNIFSNLYLEVKLNGITQYAVTNDSLIDGDDYRDLDNERVYNEDGDLVQWSYSNLLGVDSLSGIVQVGFDILDSYDIHATYSYMEDSFELTSLNMNPIFDQDVHNQLRAVYIVPSTPVNNNQGSQTASIRWVKMSPAGVIEETNQDGTEGNENLNTNVALSSSEGTRLTGVLGMHYNWRSTAVCSALQEILSDGSLSVNSTDGFPPSGWLRFLDSSGVMRYAEYTERTDTAFVFGDNVPDTVAAVMISNGTTVELVNFLDERTTLSTRTGSDELGYLSASDTYPVSFSRYFILAEMCINPPHSHKELVFIDLREDGGGIIPDKYEEAKAIQPKVQWYNDFGDFRGQIYPGNATVVVKLPSYILTTFTEDQIEQIIDQNMPMGIKPIVRYYGYEPHVTRVRPDIFGDD